MTRSRPRRWATLALAVVVLAAAALGWAAKSRLGSAVRDAAALDLESGSVVDAAAQHGAENVLVVASDTGAAPIPGTAPGARTDTVVVAHVPEDGRSVVALSVPTDLEINRPPCERFDPVSATYTDETVPAQARTQLASAVEVGGPHCTTRVVQQLTGLAITKYVGIDLARLGDAVDAVGGVEVCVPRPVVDRVLGQVAPDLGLRRLDGLRAADYLRAADVPGDPGHGRFERQQQVLAALLGTALSDTGLLDAGQVAALRPALGAALVADGAGLDEVLALALSLRKLDVDGVTFTVVPTAPGPNGRAHTVLRDADASALFAALRTDAPLPDGAAGDPPSFPPGRSPADVSVQVLNASDRTGLAAQVGATLRALGFGVSEVADAEAPNQPSVIRFSPDRAEAAGLLATTVPSATPVPEPGAEGVLVLVLGRSFDDVIRAPTEPLMLRGPAPDATQTRTGCT